MTLLGLESNTSIWQKSAKLVFRGGKSQVPHPLYEILLTLPYCPTGISYGNWIQDSMQYRRGGLQSD